MDGQSFAGLALSLALTFGTLSDEASFQCDGVGVRSERKGGSGSLHTRVTE